MNFYRIEEGEYDDYRNTILVHDEKFTKEEFIDMINVVANKVSDEDVNFIDHYNISKHMVKLFRFKIVNPVITVELNEYVEYIDDELAGPLIKMVTECE